MQRYCKNCGKELKEKASFCSQCGQPVDEPAEAAQEPAEEKESESTEAPEIKADEPEPTGDNHIEPAETTASESEEMKVLPRRVSVFTKRNVIIGVTVIAVLLIGFAGWYFYKQYQNNTAFEVLMSQGDTSLDNEDYEDALTHFENAIALNDKKAQPYEGKAEAHWGMERYDAAEAAIEKAKMIETTDRGKVVTAMIYADTSRKDEGKRLLDEVAENDPKEYRIILNAGKTYDALEDYESAEALLKKGIGEEQNPERLKKLYNELIASYVGAGKTEAEIIQLLKEAAEKTGDTSYTEKQEQYIVKPVKLSVSSGEYDAPLTVKAETEDSSNTLYYTRDGSEPTVKSEVFPAAGLTLDEGEYTIKVLPLNQAGVKGKSVTEKYTVKKHQMTEAEFNAQIQGAWYHTDSMWELMVGKGMMAYGPIDHIGATIIGPYEILELMENGAKVGLHLEKGDDMNRSITIDFGEPGDGKILIDGTEYLAGEYIGNGRWAYPKIREKLGDGKGALMPKDMY